MNEMNEEEREKLEADCYQYIAEFSKEIYENEVRRGDSIIQRANNMQTSFSFVSAAVFMVAPVVVEYRGTLSLVFLLLTFSSIALALIFSLLFATIAQRGEKREDYPTITEFKKTVEEKPTSFQTVAQREKYLANTYEKIHISHERSNEERIKWVGRSRISFYCALALCIFWFLIAICKMI